MVDYEVLYKQLLSVGNVVMESLSQVTANQVLWSVLSNIDSEFFHPQLLEYFSFSFETIIRLSVQFAYQKCKISVSNKYMRRLLEDRTPQGIAAFLIFLAVHSDRRQVFVEHILSLSEDFQRQAMKIIETNRKEILENDLAEVLAKVNNYEIQLQQQVKKVAERDQKINSLTVELQTVFNLNIQLKQKLNNIQQDQRQAIQQLQAGSLDGLVLQHMEIVKQRDHAQKELALKKEQVEMLQLKCKQLIDRINEQDQQLQQIREAQKQQAETRESFSVLLKETQESEIYRQVARMSTKQDSLKMDLMVSKRMAEKHKTKANQRSAQLSELYRHLKGFQKKVKKIKAQRNPQLDSMIRTSHRF